MAKSWYWDKNVRRYRNPDGTFLSERKVVQFRDAALDHSIERARELAIQVYNGTISSATFKAEMRQVIKQSYGAQYVYGRGGFKQMTPSDWGTVGAAVKRQYAYLDGFVTSIAAGELVSEDQIAARAAMYAKGSVQAHSRGLATAWGIDLPGHPGDGATECLGNCRCNWRIEKLDGVVYAYWTIGGSDPCSGCLTRAGQWDPYIASEAAA